MPLEITITDAGRAAIINAENTGTDPVTITEIGVGSGRYNPTASQTTLQTEIKRLNTIAGAAVDDDVIHITMSDNSSDSYSVGEIGLFTDAGVLLALYSQPSGSGWIVEKATQAQLLLAIDITLTSINAASITFGDTDFSNSPATQSVVGVVRLADDQETIDGAQGDIAVTPLGLAAVVALINQAIGNNTTLINNNTTAITALEDSAGDLFDVRAWGASDYIRIPDVADGFIIQWGANEEGTYSFPTAFPNAYLAGVTGDVDSANQDFISFSGLSLSQFQIQSDLAAANSLTSWIAIGY
ncbi:gp53-like domain-containing protein [Marinobacterium sedimentorum]|uniref:gp53-like domain-containing protein n=1 Tax=Marinobacterium sedimentorum TaxID=2927804 RepID=UPI0020C6A4BD|nr:phage tail protein [Marinobacterium sedimentorum]MCP8687746.1 phage tail protein [Marinobacterium sedimentorum]